MKTLGELQALCGRLGVAVQSNGRSCKEMYIAALRDHLWRQEHPDEPLPEQILPMLLGDWADLDEDEACRLEEDENGWVVQPKMDGVRTLLHVSARGIRITGRCVSEVTFRLSEFQANLPHLTTGWEELAGTILDGELVCPATTINTGKTVTANPLQAVVAIVATSSQNASDIQQRHNAWVTFHPFDILRLRGQDLTGLPLRERLSLLEAIPMGNSHVHRVPTYAAIKPVLHATLLSEGAEGTVWKHLDRPYEPGRRVKHWIKRKGTVQLEAFVSGFKPGTPGKGHESLVGAVEFSVPDAAGNHRPVGWVSSWPDDIRQDMTTCDEEGQPKLAPSYLGRRAVLIGQDWSAKSRRLRSARLLRWV
jgi:ATP-dependent DNA ligase